MGATDILMADQAEADRQASEAEAEAWRAELAGPNPSPLERILAERAALCWRVVHWFESSHANDAAEMTLSQADCHQRRIDRAHKRFLSACLDLAKVRRLALPVPAMQVHVKADVSVEVPAERPAVNGRVVAELLNAPRQN